MYTPQGYEELIKTLVAEGYEFLSFEDTAQEGKKSVYLRHDIDCSMEWALAMARVNNKHGVRGTFGFQLRCPLYNLFSKKNVERMNEIAKLNQFITLHFTFGDQIPNEEALIAQVIEDYELLKKLCPATIKVISWHSPSVFPNFKEKVPTLAIPEFVNSYSTYFLEEIPYVSDSNMRHTTEELTKTVKENNGPLHLLCHPFMWFSQDTECKNSLLDGLLQVLREKEHEYMGNWVYGKEFPNGLLDGITHEDWLALMDKAAQRKK